MIGYLLFVWQRALRYIADNLHLLVVLVLLFLFPVLFIYSGQQFLEAGRANQEQLQKDRIAALHDALQIIVETEVSEPAVWQATIDKFTGENEDIEVLLVQKQQDDTLENIVSSDQALLYATSTFSDWHAGASVRPNTTMIYRSPNSVGSDWYTYRMFKSDDSVYFIAGVYSMSESDNLFASREREAYWSLGLVYLLVGLLGVWHYMLTDYRRLYRSLKERQRAQISMLNTVVHELRAPLTAIRGFSDMQSETNEVETLHEHALKIKSASERTLLLVNDLLDAARIQSGRLELEDEVVSVASVIRAVLAELQAQATQQDVKLVHDISESLKVAADRERLQQVFVNIISNSVKYTKHGTVSVSAIERKDEVEIRVADTGVGIESSDQQKIFTPFFRVESKETAVVTGTGLGMWITKQLVSAMAGSIGVESIKGTGTHVVLRLPKADS